MGNLNCSTTPQKQISIFDILRDKNSVSTLCAYLKHPQLRNILMTQIEKEPTMILKAVGMRCSYKCLEILIHQGCNVNKTSVSNWSALHEAIQYRDRDMVYLLVKSGSNLFCWSRQTSSSSNQNCEEYHVPFTLAVERWGPNNHQHFHDLLPFNIDTQDLNPDPKVEKSMGMSIKGCTMLIYACMSGSLVAVKILVEDYRADINKSASCGMIPIQAAMICGHTHIVRYLKDLPHANLSLCRWNDVVKHKMAVKQLLYSDDLSMQQLILQTRVDVNILVEHKGQLIPPVMIATIDDKIEPCVLICLLTYGANINWVSPKTKSTALWCAINKNRSDKIMIILRSQLLDMFLTLYPNNVLKLALHMENLIIIEMLVDAGCDLHNIDIHSNIDILHRYQKLLKPETIAKFKKSCETPRPLMETAMIVIRKAIGYDMVQCKISTLAIPESVKQYLYQVGGDRLSLSFHYVV